MAWFLVPLQYLFSTWKAESLIARAASAKKGATHRQQLYKAEAAVLAVEVLQRRFPKVTDAIDARRRRYALRAQIES